MPRKSYPSSKAISGMYFPSSASSGNCIPFQASILGRNFRLSLIGKRRPTLRADCGMHFPVLLSLGKCIPFLDRIMGRNFPLERLWESVSHFDRPEWDALSAKALQRETTSHSKGKFRDAFSESLPIRKARPTLDASGHGTIDLSGLPSIKRRPPGRRGTKFIASSARKEGHLMWPSSCAEL